MKKIIILKLFFASALFLVIATNFQQNINNLPAKNTDLSELTQLAIANAEGVATCSVKCDDGTSVSLTCMYECRVSTLYRGVRCFDANGNIVEEVFC